MQRFTKEDKFYLLEEKKRKVRMKEREKEKERKKERKDEYKGKVAAYHFLTPIIDVFALG